MAAYLRRNIFASSGTYSQSWKTNFQIAISPQISVRLFSESAYEDPASHTEVIWGQRPSSLLLLIMLLVINCDYTCYTAAYLCPVSDKDENYSRWHLIIIILLLLKINFKLYIKFQMNACLKGEEQAISYNLKLWTWRCPVSKLNTWIYVVFSTCFTHWMMMILSWPSS